MAVAVMARALSCRRLLTAPGVRTAVDGVVLLFMGLQLLSWHLDGFVALVATGLVLRAVSRVALRSATWTHSSCEEM
jgi:hypothetical protein